MDEQKIMSLFIPLYSAIKDDLQQMIRDELWQAMNRFDAVKKPERMYTRAEACAILHITTTTLWSLTKNGYIKSIKSGKRVLYSETDMNKYLEYGRLQKQIDDAKQSQLKKEPPLTYIMFDEATGLYKIGKSVNPHYREGTLQSEKPTVKLLFTSSLNVENTIHKEYTTHRVRGEWFRLSDDEINHLVQRFNFTDA